MSMSSINFLHLMVPEYKPREDFKGQGHYRKVKGEIKVTLTSTKNIPTKYQPPIPYNFQAIAQTRF